MTSNLRERRTKTSPGDSAVDGLLAGTGAGVLMALYVVAAGLLQGQGLGAILAQFDPSPVPAPLRGVLAHLAVAGIYGLMFGLAWRWLGQLWARRPAWLAGLGYGLVLWGLALLLLRLPAPAAPEGWLAGLPPVHLAGAHLVYGAALGWLLGRRPAA